jgi:steroid delta-isomerase-like uncharacterized protein
VADARQVVAQATDAFNAHDEDRIRSLFADNCVLEGPGDLRLEGRDPVTQYSMSWLQAFPDATITVHNEQVAGDWVTQEATFSGTHKEVLAGPTGEIPPTSRTVNGRVATLFQIQDGKIARQHLYFDQVQLLIQLGLMPEMGVG